MRNQSGTLPGIGPFQTFVGKTAKVHPRRAVRFHLPKERIFLNGKCVRLVACDDLDRMEALLAK